MSTIVDETLSIDAQREELGAILGLDGPVAEEVLAAAVANERYARNLLVCRGTPELMEGLLANPPRAAGRMGAVELAVEGTRALLRWGATGFTVAAGEQYRARLAACEACPHLSTPPAEGGARVLYRLAGTRAAERTVCTSCGCVVTRKARLPAAACPEPHPDRPGFNRWNEPDGGTAGIRD